MKHLLSRLVQWMIRRWDLDDGLYKVEVQNTHGYRRNDTLAIWTTTDESVANYVKIRYVCGDYCLVVRSWPKKVTTKCGIQTGPKVY